MGKKANAEVLPPRFQLNPHHTQRLDSLRAIRLEQGRVYRAMVRGRLCPEDATRVFYCIREIRSTVELEMAEAARLEALAAAAAANAPAPHSPLQVNILSIPSGHSVVGDHVVPNEEIEALRQIEHQPPAEAPAPIETPRLRLVEPEPVAELLAKLNAMTNEQLAVLAELADDNAR